MLPYFWINPNVGADQSKLPFLLSFSDHWIKVLFPFKKKISYLCKTKSNCHALSSWFSFLFVVVCFPIKFRTSLQANLLMIFLKKKWVEFIEHSSLNHLNLGENPSSSWWSFKEKVEIKLGKDSKHVLKDEGVMVRWEGACQVVREGLEILS